MIYYMPDALTGFTLSFTNECHSDCEKQIEAMSDQCAIQQATDMCVGQEGLWSGISLVRDDGKELDFNHFG